MGGPDLLAKTINQFTGLPIHYWVLAGFETFTRIVDEVGGVMVYVDRRMDDRYSGAYYERGWHHFVGGEALAYARDRHDTPDGDFTRSLNQGKLALAGLAKLRAEVVRRGRPPQVGRDRLAPPRPQGFVLRGDVAPVGRPSDDPREDDEPRATRTGRQRRRPLGRLPRQPGGSEDRRRRAA